MAGFFPLLWAQTDYTITFHFFFSFRFDNRTIFALCIRLTWATHYLHKTDAKPYPKYHLFLCIDKYGLRPTKNTSTPTRVHTPEENVECKTRNTNVMMLSDVDDRQQDFHTLPRGRWQTERRCNKTRCWVCVCSAWKRKRRKNEHYAKYKRE